jgi:hypothetical protein
LNIISIIVYFSALSVLFPLAIAIFYIKWSNRLSGLIILLCSGSLLSDGVSILLSHYKINNWLVANLFLFLQFVVFFNLFKDIEKNKLRNALFIFCCSLNLLDFFFLHTPFKFNSYATYANGIVLIILSIRFLHGLMKDMQVEKIHNLPLLWLSFCILSYYGGTIFLFLFNNYVIHYLPHSYGSIWILHNLLNILKNFLLFLTLWIQFKNQGSQQ